jgi:hypothetical protein
MQARTLLRAKATCLLAERELLAHISQCNLLWRGDYDCAIDAAVAQVLRDGDVLVGCARWSINNLR